MALFEYNVFLILACVDEPNWRSAQCGVGQFNVCYKQCWLVFLHVLN